MPEGPSIVILKEAVQALHLEGQEIVRAGGNTKMALEQLVHRKVIAFCSWGKHFLICFEHSTLRVHLFLFGSYRINERRPTPARLSIGFEHDELNFYNCSLLMLDQPADEIYDWSSDIMADEWDPDRALRKLLQAPDMLV